MAGGGQRLVFAGFGGALEGADFILVAPHQRAVGIFLAVGFVELLHVVGVAFENDVSQLGVKIHDDFGVTVAGVGEAPPGAHQVGRR